jgi:hypothetical protein
MVSEPDSVHVSCGLLIISLASELVAAVERSLSRRHALALFGPIRTFDPRNLSWLGPTTQGAQGEVCRARAVLRIVSSFKQLFATAAACLHNATYAPSQAEDSPDSHFRCFSPVVLIRIRIERESSRGNCCPFQLPCRAMKIEIIKMLKLIERCIGG